MSALDQPDDVDFGEGEIDEPEYASEEEERPPRANPVQLPEHQPQPPVDDNLSRRQRRRARQVAARLRAAEQRAAERRRADLRTRLERRRGGFEESRTERPVGVCGPALRPASTDPGAIIESLQHLLALGYALGTAPAAAPPSPYPGQYHSGADSVLAYVGISCIESCEHLSCC